MSAFRMLYFVVLCVSVVTGSAAQPVLNFKRINILWPTIELHFAVSCNGTPQFPLDPANYRVREEGVDITKFTVTCPDLNTPCPASIAVAFDASSSMVGAWNTGAKEAGHGFVRALTPGTDQCAVFWYSGTVTMAQGMTSDTTLLHTAIDGLPASGGAAVWDGIYNAVQHTIAAGANPCSAVIVLCDGGDNASTHDLYDSQDLAIRNRLRIFTIGLGTTAPSAALQSAATSTGGRYYQAQSAAEVPAFLSEILDLVRHGWTDCMLSYQAVCKDGTTRRVELSVLGVCNGEVMVGRSYKAAHDTSSFTSVNIGLDSIDAMGGSTVTLPLRLLAPLQGGTTLQPAVCALEVDTTVATFIGIQTPPGSLLAGVPTQWSRIGNTLYIETLGKTEFSGPTTTDTLALLTFVLKDITATDTVRLTLNLHDWHFTSGCLRPMLQSGLITIARRKPELRCEPMYVPPLKWDAAAGRYSPEPQFFSGAISNSGSREAINAFMTIGFDTRDLVLVQPTTTTQQLTPKDVPLRSTAQATWEVAVRPRLKGDTIGICYTTTFNNHLPFLCCYKVWIPAAQPRVNPAGPVFVCAGDSVLLQGAQGFASIHWSTGDTTPTLRVRSVGMFWYRVTDWYGNTGYSDTVQVLYRAPVIPVLELAGALTLCEGSVVPLRTVGKYVSYVWSNGARDSVAMISQPGSYYVTVVDSNGCVGRSDALHITTAAGPRISVGGTANVCSNTEAVYSMPRRLRTRYAWSVFGGEVLTGQGSDSVRVRWGKNGDGLVIGALSDSVAGCTAFDTLRVRITRPSHPQIRVQPSTTICEGDSVLLETEEGYAAYLWSDGSRTRSITVRKEGLYAVTVSDVSGCSALSDSVVVRVEQRPLPVIAGPQRACRSAETQYGVHGNAGASVRWDIRGGLIVRGAFDTVVVIRWTATDTAHVGVDVTQGLCTGSATLPVLLGSSIIPVITVHGSSTLCAGDTAVLDAGDGYTVYRWSTGAQTRSIAVTEAGTYTVSVESTGGCSGSSNPVVVQVLPRPPVPLITRSGDRLSTREGAARYQWYHNNTPIAGSTTYTHQAVATGVYHVAVTDSNGCSSASATFDVGTLGVVEIEGATDFDVYPEPSRGEFTITFPHPFVQPLTLTLRDILGRIVHTATLDPGATGRTHTVRLGNPVVGVYYLEARSGQAVRLRMVRVVE
ncbi:MAG: VWA domain-containing protein [Ignavibacteriae bacterium]|nr:VWA domain-containing protein [Ignavibacteriota bacterium]